MTFKHVSFVESEVMRSLEKNAIKKGTFPKVSAIDLVKTAEAKKSFVPTEDLNSDILKLASGLRERGFVKEANSLEDKLFIKATLEKSLSIEKQADVHLYRSHDEDGEDIIDFAHPDGDAKVSDAQNQNGVVETILSGHKKMVDMVNKQPTGKNANSRFVQNIVLATAEVLDVNVGKSFLKFADETLDPVEIESAGKSDEELLLDPETQKKIEEVNKGLLDNKNNALEMAQRIFGFLGFNNRGEMAPRVTDLLKTSDGMVAFSGYAKSNVIPFYNVFEKLFPGKTLFDEISSDELFAQIIKFTDYNSLFNFFNPLLGETAIFSKYFVGTNFIDISEEDKNKLSVLAQKNSRYRINPSSMWTVKTSGWTGADFNFPPKIDQKIAKAAAAEITSFILSQKKQLIDSKIPVAESNIKSIFNNLVSKASKLYLSIKNIPIIKTSSRDTLIALQNCFKSIEAVKKEMTNKDVIAYYAVLSDDGAIPSANSDLQNITEKLKESLGQAAEIQNPSDKKIEEIDDKAANTFLEIAKIYNKTGNNVNKKLAISLFHIVNNAKGKQFSDIAAEIKTYYPKTDTYAKLMENANIWLADAQKEIGKKGSLSNDKIKSAQAPQGAQGVKPSGAPQGTAAGHKPVSPQEKQNVKLMQDALRSLADSQDAAGADRTETINLRNTGQGPNTVSGDGIWGQRTNIALQTANKLLNLNLVVSRNPASAAQDAQKNYSVIQQVFGKSEARDTTVLDLLPNNMFWTNQPELVAIDDSSIPLTTSDLLGLGNLYSFLSKHGLIQSRGSSDDESLDINNSGIPLNTFSSILTWFKKRSAFLINAGRSKKIYYDKISQLEADFSKLYLSLIRSGKNDNDIIPGNYLVQNFNNSSGASSGNGSTYSQKQKRNNQQSGNIDMNGEKLSPYQHKTATIPFSNTIDLSSEWYEDLDWQNSGLPSPILHLENFEDQPGARMASHLFGNAATGDVLGKYQGFLNNLKSSIMEASRTWNGPSAMRNTLDEYYMAWSRAIDKQIRDIVAQRVKSQGR